jgi:hypothetical protein
MKPEDVHLRSNAESVGFVLGLAAARRVDQLLSKDSLSTASLSSVVLKAVQEMYVVMATSDDPFAAVDQTLHLESNLHGG